MTSKVFLRGDMGAIVASETHENKAGVGGLLTGNVGGSGNSTMVETSNSGSIVAGDIEISGVLTHSPTVREDWDGAGRIVRNVISGKVLGKMIDSIIDASRIAGRTNVEEIRAGTAEAAIKAEAETSKAAIRAATISQ